MSTVTEQHMLIFTDIDNNNNKFWEGVLKDDNTLTCRWGRVGERGQSRDFSGGAKKLAAKLREKKRKGYEEAMILKETGPAVSVGKSRLKKVAAKQIDHGSCAETSTLIEFLVKVNRHQISAASGGKIFIDDDDGLIRTPLGVVNQEAIDAARIFLTDIGDCVQVKSYTTKKWKEAVNKFTRLIPQDVGRGRGWDKKLFPNISAVRKQNDLLDSLQTTLTHVLDNPAKTKADAKEEDVFKVKLVPLTDDKVLSHIRSFYYKSVKKMHSSYGMKISRAWVVDIETMRKKYETDGAGLSNVWELWHGTKASNVLSILKGGLVIPPSTAGHVCGRMFGDGLYFSDQSTKSLNYATGYWDGSSEERCFMFMSDVAMGETYVPKSTYWGQSNTKSCPKGYDSTFAKANVSGVQNNEMIVYRTSQANLRFLVEFVR
tara:strand:- start:84222 stop:85511 length:1290 start_codon:yes stop_codon:yes gene_type:complete